MITNDDDDDDDVDDDDDNDSGYDDDDDDKMMMCTWEKPDDKNPSVNGFSVNGDSGRGDEDLAIFYTADYSYNSEIKNCSKKEFFTFPLLSK